MMTSYLSNQRAQKDPRVMGEVGVAAGDVVLPEGAGQSECLVVADGAAAEAVVVIVVGDVEPQGDRVETHGYHVEP